MSTMYHVNHRMLRELEQIAEYLASIHSRDTQPDKPADSVSVLYRSGNDAVEGKTYKIYDQYDMDDFVLYVNGGRKTKGVTFEIELPSASAAADNGASTPPLPPANVLTVYDIIAPIILKADPNTNSPVIDPSSGPCFEGTFDGKDNFIKVILPAPGSSSALPAGITPGKTFVGAGLFGGIGEYGMVTRLRVTGSVTVPDGESAGEAVDAVGGVAAYNCGIIDHVISNVTVKAPSCYNVGGIAGFNDAAYAEPADEQGGVRGTIRNCANKGDVTGKEKVGGIAGENAGLIASCSNGGDITATIARKNGVGGIAGRNGNNNTPVETGVIEDCYNKGAVLCQIPGTAADPKNQGQWVGGITGFQNSNSICGYCYNIGDVTGYSYVHNIVGENDHLDDDGKPAGVTNSYGLDGQAHTSSTTPQPADGGTDLSLDQMTGRGDVGDKKLVDLLNEGDKEHPYWTQSSGAHDGYPTLENDDKRDASQEKIQKPQTVYLEAFNGEGGDGSSDNPYQSLQKAIDAAGAGGKIILTKTIKITKATKLNAKVTFERQSSDVEPMFEIAVDNIASGTNGEMEIGYLTMSTSIIDGGGSGTLFKILKGRLRLRGNIVLKNCDTAVSVESQGSASLDAAQVEVDYADITANDYAVVLANENSGFFLDAFETNEVKIKGTIKLVGAKTCITVEAEIPCVLEVECVDKESGDVVVQGTKDFPLTEDDIDMLEAVNARFAWDEDTETIIIR